MEKVASGEFKKDFGKVLQEAYRKPVTITRHGRDFVTLVSSQDFFAIQNEILGEYYLEKVQSGAMSFLEAVRAEKKIINDIIQARQDYDDGKYFEYHAGYSADIKQKFLSKAIH
ncbi:MAG: type II toxin-antitoxin system prevent-host-death family antitoxin [Pasteurella sp.]|nr:type II toxin-antitoxin system prevent-host-death family antitoxin [Pasteurella sp.]MBS9783027.1 type II toxin-antitoxin system prevent-host-death family antitoxin [Pasteurella sp.]